MWHAGGADAAAADPAEQPVEPEPKLPAEPESAELDSTELESTEQPTGRSFVERDGRAADGHGLSAARQQRLVSSVCIEPPPGRRHLGRRMAEPVDAAR